MSLLATLISAGGAAPKLYSDDVFSAYTYTGNGATQTINNGIDLAGKGGAVWAKSRASTQSPLLTDSATGRSWGSPSGTGAFATTGAAPPGVVSSFNASGYTLGLSSGVNLTGETEVSWTFRNAKKFFLNTTVTKSSGSNATVDLSSLGTVGMVMVKRTDSAGSWYVFHRSATAGKLLYLEQTASEATLGHITVSGTTLTLVNGVIADGSYVVYAWAHDSSADGIVQCGSFTTDGSGNATVNLGWEPQFIIEKGNGVLPWVIVDASRGLSLSSDGYLTANSTNAEAFADIYDPFSTGFYAKARTASTLHFYLAIRRSNKPPTTGTQVYNAIARTGTGAAATVTGVGFAPDLCIIKNRSVGANGIQIDRLRGGAKQLLLDTVNAELTDTTVSDSSFFSTSMDGVRVLTNAAINGSGAWYINYFFKRAPGVFDVVCDAGTGSAHTVSHGLGVAPELIIRKGRSGATAWTCFASGITNTEKLVLNTTAAKATDTTAWNSTSPTSASFTVGTGADVNTSAATYVTYLFATKAGISKVGGYTGNGSSQTINCGFTTGARFILIKRTDAAGDWLVWSSTTGIVAGNDPHLSLNTTAAEVTTDDSIDPDVSGFIVNQLAATNLNVTSASYIYLSFS